ncbi:hypothetical protein SAMN05421690_10993 [Nitrosomonas sp. Nm51]|nr:hypothetical protein SAMN05421690_10993 [Nitrosomonas sp. Nm51]
MSLIPRCLWVGGWVSELRVIVMLVLLIEGKVLSTYVVQLIFTHSDFKVVGWGRLCVALSFLWLQEPISENMLCVCYGECIRVANLTATLQNCCVKALIR